MLYDATSSSGWRLTEKENCPFYIDTISHPKREKCSFRAKKNAISDLRENNNF